MTAIASHYVDTSPPADPPRAKRLSPVGPANTPEQRAVRYLQTVDPAADVFAIVKRWSRFSQEDLSARDQHKRISLYRHIAAWLLRECRLSFPEIGRELGGRDHTTMMSSVAKVDQWRVTQPRDYPVDVRAVTDAMLVDLGLMQAGPQPSAVLPAIPDLIPGISMNEQPEES